MRVLKFVMCFGIVLGASIAPMTSFGGYYYGSEPLAPSESSSNSSPKANYVVLSGDNSSDWHARSLLSQEDEDFVKRVVRAHGTGKNANEATLEGHDDGHKYAAVYLYDPKNEKEPLRITDIWLQRNKDRIADLSEHSPGPYQWLKYETKDGHAGVIFVKRMPRAVTFTDTQEEILDFYKDLGTLEKNDTNEKIKWTGPYRVIKDQAIIEIRVLPDLERGAADPGTLSNILKTVTDFFKCMSVDHCAPSYPTDKSKDRPSLAMCYAAHPNQDMVFNSAGFEKTVKPIFKEFFDDEMQKKPECPAIVYHKKFSACSALKEDPSLARFLRK